MADNALNLPIEGGGVSVSDITDKTLVTPAAADEILIVDDTDAALKKVTAQSIADLATAEAWWNPVNTEWKIIFDEMNWRTLTSTSLGPMQIDWAGSFADAGPDPGDENRVGIVTATATTGNWEAVDGVNAYKMGGADIRVGMAIKFDKVPDATDDYNQWIGIGTVSTAINEGFFLAVRRVTSTTNWVSYSREGGGITANDTGIALVINTWYNLEVEMNAANDTVKYYIDGVLVDTITTNVFASDGFFMFAQDPLAGSLSKTWDMDWAYIAFKPATARGAIATWVK